MEDYPVVDTSLSILLDPLIPLLKPRSKVITH